MKQRTAEWVQARIGHATASCAQCWWATSKTGGVPAVREEYKTKLVLERLTGRAKPTYQSAAMLAGIKLEPEARAKYAFEENIDVVEVGYLKHPRIAMSGASPDGFVGDDGLVEFKCPLPHTHLDTILKGTIPQKYFHQMQFQMAVTGRAWCDYVSYCPDYDDDGVPHMPEGMWMMLSRVPRDAEIIARLEFRLIKFLHEVEDTVQQLRDAFPMQVAA